MNAELLLEHFHRLGDAPDAVPRLRRFILDLAVRGKLVEQDASEPSALELLGAIRKEILSTARTGRNKPDVADEPVEEGDLPFDVPEGWALTRLASVALCLDHMRSPINSTERDQRIEGKDPNGLFPYYGATQQQGWIDDYIFDDELVLLGEDGVPFFDDLRPKAYIINGKSWVNNHAHVFKVIQASSKFILYCLNTFNYQGRVAGATRGKLNKSKAIDIPLALPPLPEQHRIVAKVEELMALCDRLEAAQQQREAERTRLTAAAWQAVVQAEAPADVSFALEQLPALTTRPAQVKALRQTILDLAVRGRLVEQVEGEGSGAETLAEVKRLRKELVEERRIRGGKDTEYVDAILDVPASWATPYVADVAIVLGGKRIPKGLTFSETPTPHIYIRVTDMKDGTIRTEGLKYITPEVQRTISQYTINKEDLYITIAGTIGSVGRVPEFFDGQNLTENAAKIVFRGIDPDYFRMALSTQQVQDQFTDKIKQMAQPKLAIKRVMGSRFPLPPLAEQRRIVAKVEELMALCDGLEAALDTGEALRGKVLEAVVRSETGSTEPPAPVLVRQLPVPKVRAPRYEEVEVELAVAAEPVGHTSALQAVVRRGPGRPPKNGALTSTAARSIEAYLHAHPGWHGKAAILEATGVDAGAWNAAIKELLEGGKVERQGEKKGARYRAR